MNTVRTLPIRLEPIGGEALDSWLEAIAHRTHTAFGDVLAAVALTRSVEVGTSAWAVRLAPNEAAVISQVTGVSETTLKAMTLEHYSERALRINPKIGTINRAFPWGKSTGSRFCPACLKNTGGRWQLSWRLGWTFACTIHNCLLADACPECGAVQRRRPHVDDIIPEPGRCAYAATDATGRAPARCHADLTIAPVTAFEPDHPVIRAQRIINAVIDDDNTACGVYRGSPQPRIKILADIRAVAGRVLAYATPAGLDAVLPADLLSALRDADKQSNVASGPACTATKPGLAAPARAATAAAGVVAALLAMDSPDIASAGDALRWLVTSSRERGLAVRATNMGWGKNTSPVLSAVQLTALGPMLKPIDQLRYRIGSPLPAHPPSGTTYTTKLARRLPSILWPAWSLPLSIPNCHQRQLRPVLSTALLIVNSRLNLDEAAGLIKSPIEGRAVSRVLRLLEQRDEWPGIRGALIRMATYLHEHDVPIDYERRRGLDYTMLLPDKIWAQICRDTATPGPREIRAKIARCFLFERLTGLPTSASPSALDDNSFRTKVADFPQHLTPELAHALDAHTREFLADQGIDSEPPVWYPPTDLLDGIDLPGPNPDAVNITDLHRVKSTEGNTLGAHAIRLSTSLEVVRYLLEVQPAPRLAPPPETQSRPNHNRAYCTAKAALPRHRLADLYQRQQMSLREIAATVGVSRQIIARLAGDYDLPLREPGLRARTTIDPDWLYEQYVTNRRALPDIAKEAGMSTANMARWAKTHAIPMRGRGGPSHSATLAAQDVAAETPELLRPALTGIGGWERLQRFAAATRYPTLTTAATELGVRQATLVNQINRIERELGATLLIRAERARPMKLTDDGARVVATIRACQHHGLR